MPDNRGENMNDNDREQYWNDSYVKYWKARVEEANANPNCTSSIA